jgi:outer membrane protein insertion porin family
MINKLLAIVWVVLTAGAVCAQTVKDIRVERRGAGAVDEADVLAFVSLKVGDELNRQAISRDVRALEKAGRYSYVATDVERVPGGAAVVYIVKSKPRIRRLQIDGADDLGNRKVRELLELGVGDLVDDAAIGNQVQKVKDKYLKEHYPYAQVTWKIDEDENTGTADVAVTVKEGRRSAVRRIQFAGNTSVDARTLRKPMKQKRWNRLISWLTGRGTYKPDDLETDVEAIRGAYLDRGFLDAKIGQPTVEARGRKWLDVTIPVEEGRRYQIGAVKVEGAKIFPAEDVLRTAVTNRPGDVASLASIEQGRQAVQDYYGSRGYIGNQVQYDTIPGARDDVVDVVYRIKEGELAYIRDIKIRGNTRTKDKVIRRELTVYPGDKWNSVLVRNGERRLRNMGYFGYVAAVPEETEDPTKYDLVYEVEEQKTGQFLVGVGYSSVDDLVGFAELSQGNFSLTDWPPTGAGQKLRLRGTAGTEREDIELSFTEPYFLDRRLSLGLDLFQRDASYYSDEYDQRNTGGRIRLGKPLTSFDRVNLFYGLEEVEVYNVDDEASDQIKEEEGTQTKSYVGIELIHDSRDSSFVPTRGNRGEFSPFVAGGALGGDTQIYGLEAQSSQYVPVWLDHVLNLKAWASTVEEWGDGERVPIFDRLFLGGARTLRGFKYRDVGPKDEDGEPVGGKSAWYATVEYNIPIVEKVRFATFFDIGMVYEDPYTIDFGDYNSDWGIGIRLDFPGFPLRLDYAWPLEADDFNDRDSGRFQFSIGYSM